MLNTESTLMYRWNSFNMHYQLRWINLCNYWKKNLTSVYGSPSQIPAFELTKASAKFEVATSNRLGGDAFTIKYIISLLTLTLGQGQTRKVAQYPLHHMTYASAKFEATISNGFGEITLTRNILFHKVTWSIALYIMWPLYLQSLKLLQPMVKEMHYQENTLFEPDPKVKGVKVTQNVSQYPWLHVTYAQAKFDFATSYV